MINGFEEIGWKKANIYLHVYDEVRNIRIANAGSPPPFFGGGGDWHSRFLYYWHKETSGIQIDENCSALVCMLACKEINAIRIFCDMVAAAWINDVNVKRIKSEISDCINHIDHTLLYSCSHFIIPLPAGATI